MRKVLASVLFASLSFAAMAQGPAKGSLFAFGTIGFATTNAGGSAKSVGKFTFAPGAGYFLTDKIAIGARLLVNQQFASGQKGGTEIGLQAFGRYYMIQDVFSAKGGFFLEANLGFTSAKPLYPENANPEPKSASTIGLGVGPGYALFPNPKYGFEFTLPNLLSFYTTSDSGPSGFGIGASTISTPSVTFMYFIK